MWRFLGIIFLVSFSFLSCSNGAEVEDFASQPEIEDENGQDYETLKDIILEKGAKVSWTGELEGDRLIADVHRDVDHVSSDVGLSPIVVNVAGGENDDVYPELIGFGSLDTRGLAGELRTFIEDFCKSFAENVYSGPEKFFDSKYLFNFVFFRQDLELDWVKNFGEEFPQAVFNRVEKDSQGDSAYVPVLFTSWRLGAPISSGEILQQPVRFYCNQGYVDFVLYVRLDNKKIYQISRGVFGR